MKHRSENKYGENIFMKSGTNISIHGKVLLSNNTSSLIFYEFVFFQ